MCMVTLFSGFLDIFHVISRLLWAPKPVILTRNPSIDPDFKRGSSGRELRYEGVKWLILRARVSSFASRSPFPFPANVVDVRDRNGEELRGVVCVTNGTHPTISNGNIAVADGWCESAGA